MEYQKIINLLNNTSNELSKFRKGNWVQINGDRLVTYNTNSQTRFKNTMLKSSLVNVNFNKEYSDKYWKISGSLWQYSKNIPVINNNGDIVDFNEANVTNSFNFKEKITGKAGDLRTKDVEIDVPLKCLSNFWRTVKMPLTNGEINLILAWSVNCFIVSTNVENQGATFLITDKKLYVPVVVLTTQDNAKLLLQLKSDLKRASNWNRYKSKPESLRQNQYLNHLINPSFQGVNRLFVYHLTMMHKKQVIKDINFQTQK